MIRIVVLLLLISVPHPLPGQEPAAADVAARIDAYAAPLVEAGHLSGTLLVARGGEILFEKSWGLANRETEIAFDPKTMCCVASITKPTTVILASRLIEGGQIALDDPVSRWIEDFPAGDQIQIQHLLFHRSGIPHRLTSEDQENIPRTAADMVDLARKCELDFPPGTRRNYSSGGYSVLVRVLELASGKSYQQQLQEVILDPLGLTRTRHPGPGVELPGAALSYTWTVTGRTPAVEKDYSFLIGAGSLFSTPGDLSKIARALVDGEFGERARRQLLRGGKLGWNGITNHYRAWLEYDKKTDLTVVMVSNQMTGANDLLRQVVPRIVAGDDVDAPQVPQPVPATLPPELLEKYAGRYQIGGSPMPVRARDGALFANDWILIPVSETSFYSPQDFGTVTVVLENGQPVALDWSGAEFPRLGPLGKK